MTRERLPTTFVASLVKNDATDNVHFSCIIAAVAHVEAPHVKAPWTRWTRWLLLLLSAHWQHGADEPAASEPVWQDVQKQDAVVKWVTDINTFPESMVALRGKYSFFLFFSLSASFSFVKVDGDGRASWGSPAGGGAAQKSLILKVSLLRWNASKLESCFFFLRINASQVSVFWGGLFVFKSPAAAWDGVRVLWVCLLRRFPVRAPAAVISQLRVWMSKVSRMEVTGSWSCIAVQLLWTAKTC